jgi:hypothetical protein
METNLVSPLDGSPYVSKVSSRTGFKRFQAPDAPRLLDGRVWSVAFISCVEG